MIPSGWKGYTGGALVILGSLGEWLLGNPDTVATIAEAVQALIGVGIGLGIIGVRHRQDKAAS